MCYMIELSPLSEFPTDNFRVEFVCVWEKKDIR